jgi:hypothetical protein
VRFGLIDRGVPDRPLVWSLKANRNPSGLSRRLQQLAAEFL